jgi:hypothetical protein
MKLLKLLAIVLLSFSLSTCAASGSKSILMKKHKGIDPILKPYVDRFVNQSNHYVTQEDIKDLTVGFKTYPKPEDEHSSFVIGTCWYLLGGNEIDINKKWWNSPYTSEIEKEAVMMHELAHCVLYRPHTNPPVDSGFLATLERFLFWIGFWAKDGHLRDGCPTSIMHPTVLSNHCLYKHWNYYMLELYHNSNKERDEGRQFHGHIHIMKSCKKPQVINKTKKWTEQDHKAFIRAIFVCRETYAGCLKTFIKKEPRTYQAICN